MVDQKWHSIQALKKHKCPPSSQAFSVALNLEEANLKEQISPQTCTSYNISWFLTLQRKTHGYQDAAHLRTSFCVLRYQQAQTLHCALSGTYGCEIVLTCLSHSGLSFQCSGLTTGPTCKRCNSFLGYQGRIF